MSDFKESLNDLLLVLLSIAVLMLLVYFQQSQQWNRTLKSRNQKISDLDQKIAEHEKGLAQARDTIAGLEASSKNAAEEIKSARQIIGELESGRQKNQKKIAELKSALQQKDTEVAELINARLSEMKVNTENRLSAKEGEIKHLANGAADQTRLLSEARDMIQRLEESEKALQEKLQAADQAYADLNESHQRLLDELAALKKEN
jgi:septal ring factor EnvC (AmiA/AmiB activator)